MDTLFDTFSLSSTRDDISNLGSVFEYPEAVLRVVHNAHNHTANDRCGGDRQTTCDYHMDRQVSCDHHMERLFSELGIKIDGRCTPVWSDDESMRPDPNRDEMSERANETERPNNLDNLITKTRVSREYSNSDSVDAIVGSLLMSMSDEGLATASEPSSRAGGNDASSTAPLEFVHHLTPPLPSRASGVVHARCATDVIASHAQLVFDAIATAATPRTPRSPSMDSLLMESVPQYPPDVKTGLLTMQHVTAPTAVRRSAKDYEDEVLAMVPADALELPKTEFNSWDRRFHFRRDLPSDEHRHALTRLRRAALSRVYARRQRLLNIAAGKIPAKTRKGTTRRCGKAVRSPAR